MKHFHWLDLSRGFLMCLVFLYHSTTFYKSDGDFCQYSWSFTPIFLTGFFFISGYLFTSNWETVSIKKKWMQTLRGIIIPYFLFMMAFLLPKIFLLHYDWKETVQNVFLLRASWFVIVIGALQLLFAVTIKWCKNVTAFIIISFVYGLIGYSFIIFYRNLPAWFINNPILRSSEMPGCMPACINLAFVATPFVSMGMLYRKYEEKLRLNANIALGVLVLLLYIAIIIYDHQYIGTTFTFSCCACNNYGLNIFYFIVAMIGLIPITKKIGSIKPLNYIGENTLLFYYLNIMMLRIAGMLYDKGISLLHLQGLKESLGYGNYILVSIIAIIGTFPVVWFINKYLPLFTGKKEAYNRISQKLNLKINW